jgi:hypothetical protein
VTRPLGGTGDPLSATVFLPGDAALRGLEHDLSRLATFEQGWHRVCETAWALGFLELSLEPKPEAGAFLLPRRATAPDSVGRGVVEWLGAWTSALRGGGESKWAFELVAAGRSLAVVTARRPLGRPDFDPGRFVLTLQALTDRFVRVPWAEEAPADVVAAVEPCPVPTAE